MATCYISEYYTVACVNGAALAQAPMEPAVAEQNVGISASSTQSAAFNKQTNMVRVHVDAVASVLFGANPTALTTIKRLAANQTEYFGVQAGQKIAVIANV